MTCRCYGTVLPPTYSQADCEVDAAHGAVVFVKGSSPSVKSISSWAIPAVDGTVKIVLDSVIDILIGAYLYNTTYGYFKINGWDERARTVELLNDGVLQVADSGTIVPECTQFIITPKPLCGSVSTVTEGIVTVCDEDVQKSLVGSDDDLVLKLTDHETGLAEFGLVGPLSLAADAIITSKILDKNVTNIKLADLEAKATYTPTLISNADYDAHTTVVAASGNYWTFGPFVIVNVNLHITFDGNAGFTTGGLNFTLPVDGRTSDGSNFGWIGTGAPIGGYTTDNLINSCIIPFVNPTYLFLSFAPVVGAVNTDEIVLNGYVIYPTR